MGTKIKVFRTLNEIHDFRIIMNILNYQRNCLRSSNPKERKRVRKYLVLISFYFL